MKHKALTVFAVLLVLTGLMLLIVPRISNRVGEQIAHSAIEDFKALKSKATTDEPTEKKGYRPTVEPQPKHGESRPVCVAAPEGFVLPR